MKAESLLLGLFRVLQVLGYLALVLWLMVCPLLWIVRDGLGPDSVETTGWDAVWKFSPMLLAGLILVGYTALLHCCVWLLSSWGWSELPREQLPV